MMVKLTAVHYGFDNDIFPKNFKPTAIAIDGNQSSTAETKTNVNKSDNIASIPRSNSGRVRKSLRKKKKSSKVKKPEKMIESRMKGTKAKFTCDNCGELFKTIQTFNMHKVQEFC